MIIILGLITIRWDSTAFGTPAVTYLAEARSEGINGVCLAFTAITAFRTCSSYFASTLLVIYSSMLDIHHK